MADLKKTVSIVINGQDRLSSSAKRAVFSMENVGAAARRMGVAVGAAAAAGATALGIMVKKAIDTADAAGKTATKIGVAVEELTALRYAAELNGVEQAQFDTALQRLSRRLAEYAKGTGEAKIALEELGISAFNANGKLKTADQVMREVADRFARMEDSAVKTRLAFKLFDTEGVVMINMLNQGSRGINALTDEARKFGVVIDKEAADKAAAFNDAISRIKTQLSGAAMTIAEDMLPQLVELAEAFQEFAADQKTADSIKLITDSLVGMANAVGAAVYGVQALGSVLGAATATKNSEQLVAAMTEAMEGNADGSALPLPAPQGGAAAPFTPGANEGELQQQAANVEALERIKRDLTNETTLMMLEGVEQMRMAEVFAHEERLRQIAEYGENTTLQMQTVEIEKMFHEQRMLQIEKDYAEARKRVQERAAFAVGGIFSNLAGIAAAAGEEGFAAYKIFASAEALISAYVAANRALAEGGPFLGPILAASTLALGLANVAAINSVSPGGVAHAGLDFVPQESTFLLQRGERVIQPEANRDLTEFLSNGGGATQINVMLDGDVLFTAMGNASRDGRLTLDARAVA